MRLTAKNKGDINMKNIFIETLKSVLVRTTKWGGPLNSQNNKNWIFSEPRIGVLLSQKSNILWIFSEPRIGVLLSRKSIFYGSFQIHGSGWSPSTTNQNDGFFSESPDKIHSAFSARSASTADPDRI